MSEEIKLSDIDVTIGYWDDCGNCDPDMYSDKLREYMRVLYSNREIRNGKKLNLIKGSWHEYLFLHDNPEMRFSSDCIINMNERYREYKETNKKFLRNASDKYKKLYEKYENTAHTMGGEILFPRHMPSINTERGRHYKIKDRFDLTLECIKRFYEGRESPLSSILEMDKEFFDLFGTGKDDGFMCYVHFFFLDGLIDNGKVKLFFGENDDNVFDKPDGPLAQNKEDWEKLLENQIEFLEKRNKLIQDFCDGKKN